MNDKLADEWRDCGYIVDYWFASPGEGAPETCVSLAASSTDPFTTCVLVSGGVPLKASVEVLSLSGDPLVYHEAIMRSLENLGAYNVRVYATVGHGTSGYAIPERLQQSIQAINQWRDKIGAVYGDPRTPSIEVTYREQR